MVQIDSERCCCQPAACEERNIAVQREAGGDRHMNPMVTGDFEGIQTGDCLRDGRNRSVRSRAAPEGCAEPSAASAHPADPW